MNPPDASLFDLRAGETMAGRYEIVRPLTIGGTSQLYEVRDREAEGEDPRRVLKLLSASFADEESRRRVRLEFELLEPLQHPNLVRVYGSGLAERGRAFLVMELVEGSSLYDHLQTLPGKRMDMAAAVPVLVQVADALRYAHEHRIVHRDVKPENVFLTADGVPKLGDFGSLYPASAPKRLTKAGSTIGTPGYLAPEQLAMRELDSRADVYAFGMLAYELVSGEPPHVTENEVATILKNRTHLAKLSNLPLWFRDFVQTCTELDPKDRFQSMAEVLQILRARQGDDPNDARSERGGWLKKLIRRL